MLEKNVIYVFDCPTGGYVVMASDQTWRMIVYSKGLLMSDCLFIRKTKKAAIKLASAFRDMNSNFKIEVDFEANTWKRWG